MGKLSKNSIIFPYLGVQTPQTPVTPVKTHTQNLDVKFYHFHCPDCDALCRFDYSGQRYDKHERKMDVYACVHCGFEFEFKAGQR